MPWNNNRLTPHQRQVLTWVRQHPGQRTDDMAVGMGWEIKRLRSVLLNLHKRKLIGRQEPLMPREYISTWWPEKVE